MPEIVNVDQNTEEWHKFRSSGIGSSDASIIMGVNPWKTIDQLIASKLSEVPYSTKVNQSMVRGSLLEPVARQYYCEKTKTHFAPMCMRHSEIPYLISSLDGFNIKKQLALEIKVPSRKDHESARFGKVPEKYIPQVQHILMVSKANRLDYISYDGTSYQIVHVSPDYDYQQELLRKQIEFWAKLELIKEDREKNPIIPRQQRSVIVTKK